jgi:endoglucanase
MERIELLKNLTGAFGISGYEEDVLNILKKNFAGQDTLTKDRIGSIIAKKVGKSEKPKIMFAAHMDEVGFIIPIGGWWAGNLPGLRVKIKTKKGEYVPGVIGSKPIHELSPEERKNLPKIEDMYIDIGTTKNFNVKEKFGIRPGDPVVPETEFKQMGNSDLYMAKAWDDRVGCGLLIELLNNLTATEHPNTVYLAGTVQEEVGLRGAKTAAYAIAPDIGFALDVSLCKDTPGNNAEAVEKLGGGVGILIYDRTMIPHSKLKDFVCELAELNNIPYHFTSIKGGYDTGAIHLTNFGVPCLALGVPSRYVHSGSTIISLEDYENVLNLITLIVKNLDADTLQQLI